MIAQEEKKKKKDDRVPIQKSLFRRAFVRKHVAKTNTRLLINYSRPRFDGIIFIKSERETFQLPRDNNFHLYNCLQAKTVF